ncbi:MAG: serine hydrolase, partial [Bacteroidota bacterium]
QATLDANIQAAGGLTASVLNPDGSIITASNGIANIGTSYSATIKTGLSDVSQNILAVIVLKLVEDGLITLSDVFGGGVLAGPPNFFPPTVTFEQLLNHEAGFKNFADNAGYKSAALSVLFGDLTTNYSLVNYTPILSTYVFPQGPAVPGTFLYSNTNYLALGEKLEQLQAAGTIPGSSLQDLIDLYLGVNDMEFFRLAPVTAVPTNSAAYFFNLSGIAPEALVDQTSVLTSSGASASIVATPRAVAEYMRNLFQDQVILNTASLTAFQDFANGTANPAGRLSNAYALGIERFSLNIDGTDYDFVGHVGDLNYSSVYIYSDVLQTGAFVSTNNDDVSAATVLEIARQLIQTAGDPCAGIVGTPQTIDTAFCDNESVTINGVTYNSAGTFLDTIFTAAGCDSVLLTINTTVNPTFNVTENDTINDGQSVQFGTQTLTTSGTFNETFTTAAGCDSVVTLNLVVIGADPVVTSAVQAALDNNLLSNGGLSAAVLNPDGSISRAANGFAGLAIPMDETFQLGLSDVSQLVTAVGVIASGTPLSNTVTNTAGTATIDQLLQHLSGLGDFGTAAAYNDPGLGIIFSDLTQDFSGNLAPIFALAGSQGATGSFGYANTNFLSLPIPSFTGIEEFPGATGPVTSYLFNLSGIAPEFLVNQTSVLTSAGAAGGLVATPNTMAEFMRDLFQDQTILNASQLSTLQTFNTANPAGRLGNAYGRGIERFTLNIEGTDYEFVGHVGDLNYATAFIYSDVLNTGAYVASNNNEVTDAEILEIARQLIRAANNPAACPVNPTTTNIGATICDGESFAFGGNNLTAAGTYVDSLLGADGCDSLVVLTLAVRPLPPVNNVAVDFCENDAQGVDLTQFENSINTFVGGFEYVGIANPASVNLTNGQTINVVYTEGGSGCSDTAQINVTVRDTFLVVINDTIADGQSVQLGSQTLTTSGSFTEVFTA